MLTKDDIEFLKKVPVLAPACEEALSLFKRTGTKRRYTKDEAIFWAGDRVERLFVVMKGVVEVYKDDPEGKKLTLFNYAPGDVFCLASLYVESAFANAVAIEDSTLISFESRVVDQVINLCPPVGTNLLRCLSGKLACFSVMVDEIAFKDLTSRLAGHLKVLAESSGSREIRITLDELSSRLGTCKEVVSRALKRLKERGLIERKGRAIVILDPEGL